MAAIAVSVGILGLFYRRFFLKKISPDPKSYSSGVVALLIFILMSNDDFVANLGEKFSDHIVHAIGTVIGQANNAFFVTALE